MCLIVLKKGEGFSSFEFRLADLNDSDRPGLLNVLDIDSLSLDSVVVIVVSVQLPTRQVTLTKVIAASILVANLLN